MAEAVWSEMERGAADAIDATAAEVVGNAREGLKEDNSAVEGSIAAVDTVAAAASTVVLVCRMIAIAIATVVVDSMVRVGVLSCMLFVHS